jgi:hypothetical protein
VNSAEHIELLILILELKKCVYQKVASGDCHPFTTLKKSEECKCVNARTGMVSQHKNQATLRG